jgi:uncharacterized membrane-anchored protein YhcB (DUF1043 family)
LPFLKAVEQIDKVREFVGSPEKIIGSEFTKHGEIAEQVEVGVRNARQALSQQKMTATFDRVGRTAPEDYIIDGFAVQSKFINGVNNNLEHVLKHMRKYPGFGRDGTFYNIPRDSHEVITKIMNNEPVEELAEKSVRAIREKVAAIEAESRRSFNEVVKPGVSEYADVQQGKIHETLDRHENDLDEKNNQLKDQIAEKHQPSFGEAAKAAGMGAAVGGTVTLTASIYKKYTQGKNPFKGDFSKEDWKEVGVTTGKGAIGGAVTGSAIYGLTNYAALSAPFAAAVVSAAKSVNSLVEDYQSEIISFDLFIDLGMIVCAESAIVGICTATGQTLIPAPVLGAVIGSIAGKMLAQFASNHVSGIQQKLQHDMSRLLAKVDAAYADVVRRIDVEFEHLGELTKVAFDLQHNKALLISSVELARAYGIDEKNIIKNQNELDKFMLA